MTMAAMTWPMVRVSSMGQYRWEGEDLQRRALGEGIHRPFNRRVPEGPAEKDHGTAGARRHHRFGECCECFFRLTLASGSQ